jgi:hypothetical protein
LFSFLFSLFFFDKIRVFASRMLQDFDVLLFCLLSKRELRNCSPFCRSHISTNNSPIYISVPNHIFVYVLKVWTTSSLQFLFPYTAISKLLPRHSMKRTKYQVSRSGYRPPFFITYPTSCPLELRSRFASTTSPSHETLINIQVPTIFLHLCNLPALVT